jgi:hypothetical protein
MSILKLSTPWDFANVRATAIELLKPYACEDPVLQIIAARKFHVREWLVPGVVAIAQCKRALPLANTNRFEEALGDPRIVLNLVLKIAQVRESFVALLVQPTGMKLSSLGNWHHYGFTNAVCTAFECCANGNAEPKFELAEGHQLPKEAEVAHMKPEPEDERQAREECQAAAEAEAEQKEAEEAQHYAHENEGKRKANENTPQAEAACLATKIFKQTSQPTQMDNDGTVPTFLHPRITTDDSLCLDRWGGLKSSEKPNGEKAVGATAAPQ